MKDRSTATASAKTPPKKLRTADIKKAEDIAALRLRRSDP
jgi:hypothetical protein